MDATTPVRPDLPASSSAPGRGHHAGPRELRETRAVQEYQGSSSRTGAHGTGARAPRKRLLLTGATGRIGTVIRPYLRERYDLHLVHHSRPLDPPTDPEAGEEAICADIQDLSALVPAMRGVDAVVHLAGRTGEPTWDEVLGPNVVGTYNVFEAARRANVRRVVFASTNHVTGWYERSGISARPEMPVRPDSFYGVSKACGEVLARYYVDAFGLSVICLRIGSFQSAPRNARMLSTWLSPRDCAQLVWRSVETDLQFGVFYGISRNSRRVWDLTESQRLLGYEPLDDAEDYASPG